MSDIVPPHERPERGPLKLPKYRRWTIYFISFGVWLTGAVWLIYHYYLWTEGKFGHVRHPLEAWWLKAHGLFSFWSVWAFGLLWSVHIIRGWNANWRRWSGTAIAVATFVLIITGYMLYYVDGKGWRAGTSLVHWILGLAALVVFLFHWLSKGMPKRAKKEAPVEI